MRLAAVAAALGVMVPGFAGAAQTGSDTFMQQCSICHQSGGVGVPGQFPRLAGRVGIIASDPAGRQFLMRLVLNGMAGSVTVDGHRIIGAMPGFAGHDDDQLAGVLDYVAGLGRPAGPGAAPFAPAEIAALRAQPRLSPTQMNAERRRLFDAKIIP